MATILTIFIAFVFIIGMCLLYKGLKDNDFHMGITGFIITGAFIIVLLIKSITYNIDNDKYTPQAIDVYRGNTTLQITYQDNVPIDTVVVFK